MSQASRRSVLGPFSAVALAFFGSACSTTIHGTGSGSDVDGGAPFTTNDGGGGGNDPGTPPTGMACSDRSQCTLQGHDMGCAAPSCINGVCAIAFSPKGTVLTSQTQGDCRRMVCDGAGGVESQPDMGDVPATVMGDCKTAKCDASGNVTQVPDDSDLPASKEECAPATCSGGATIMTPKSVGAACTEGGGRFCNGSGECRYCPTIDLTACPDTGSGAANNSTAATAFKFADLTNDDAARETECGVLKSGDTAHWLTYVGYAPTFVGVDEFETDPSVLVFASTPVHTCVYVDATYGTEFTCPSGTTMDTAPAPVGKPGCCQDLTASGFTIKSPDGRQVWMKIELPNASTCVPYELTFHD